MDKASSSPHPIEKGFPFAVAWDIDLQFEVMHT